MDWDKKRKNRREEGWRAHGRNVSPNRCIFLGSTCSIQACSVLHSVASFWCPPRSWSRTSPFALLFHIVLETPSSSVFSASSFLPSTCDDSPWLQTWGFLNDVAVSSHGLSQNNPAGIVVSVHHEAAVRALIDAHGKRHLLTVTTGRAGLRRIGRVDTHQQSLSFLKAMGPKCQRSQFVSVILAHFKQICAQCFIRCEGRHMFLKLYSNESLWLLRSQIGENFLEETVCLSRCDTPSPAWALLTPAWAMGVIRDMSSKCTMKPIYQFPISVSNAYLQKVARVLAICPSKATPYHDRAFTIKQTGNICQCLYIQCRGKTSLIA
jgi:hypothetical protein